jgi:hypothetical protein
MLRAQLRPGVDPTGSRRARHRRQRVIDPEWQMSDLDGGSEPRTALS